MFELKVISLTSLDSVRNLNIPLSKVLNIRRFQGNQLKVFGKLIVWRSTPKRILAFADTDAERRGIQLTLT